MGPILVIHIAAGGVGILAGAMAGTTAKGGRLHRRFGTVFLAAMITLSALGVWLALTAPQAAGVVIPRGASAAVGVFTAYLAVTGWHTARRAPGPAGGFEYAALATALGAAAVLAILGRLAAASPTGLFQGAPPAPYFVFAGFAAFAAVLDLDMIRRGGVAGARRLARHLWRMCFALFFAASFFFLGQQKVMPAGMQGSPWLLVPALAPLGLMAFWLARVSLGASARPGRSP